MKCYKDLKKLSVANFCSIVPQPMNGTVGQDRNCGTKDGTCVAYEAGDIPNTRRVQSLNAEVTVIKPPVSPQPEMRHNRQMI